MTRKRRLPDTVHGALGSIRNVLGIALEAQEVRAIPDPGLAGVWKIECPDGRAFVVEMAGYRDVWGRDRADDVVEEGFVR